MTTLSAIIITKNEAHNISPCIASLFFANEIIVLDANSSDHTVDLARDLKARVEVTANWPGFGPQKNHALDLATGEWILSIDADERVTVELAQHIQEVLTQSEYNAYEISRSSEFCRRAIRHSGWSPDYVTRLFRRGTARFSEAAVHEKLITSGSVGRLQGHLLHFPYRHLEEAIKKMNQYSSEAALMMHKRNKQTGIFGVLGHPIWTFIRIYIIRRGFMDGRHGMILALTAAAGSFFRYAKLLFLNDEVHQKNKN